MEPLGVVAIYGAVVATATAIVQAIRIHRDQARIKVKVKQGMLLGSAEQTYGFENAMIIKVINEGRRPVTLTSGGLRLSDNRDLITLQPVGMLPHELGEKASHDIMMSVDKLKETFRTLDKEITIKFAWVEDQTEHIYKNEKSSNKILKSFERDWRS